MVKIWCITLEHSPKHQHDLFDPDDFGMSLVGLFASKETAIKYANKHTDRNIEWSKSLHDECYEGVGSIGQYYLLFDHEILGEDDKGGFCELNLEETTND